MAFMICNFGFWFYQWMICQQHCASYMTFFWCPNGLHKKVNEVWMHPYEIVQTAVHVNHLHDGRIVRSLPALSFPGPFHQLGFHWADCCRGWPSIAARSAGTPAILPHQGLEALRAAPWRPPPRCVLNYNSVTEHRLDPAALGWKARKRLLRPLLPDLPPLRPRRPWIPADNCLGLAWLWILNEAGRVWVPFLLHDLALRPREPRFWLNAKGAEMFKQRSAGNSVLEPKDNVYLQRM